MINGIEVRSRNNTPRRRRPGRQCRQNPRWCPEQPRR